MVDCGETVLELHGTVKRFKHGPTIGPISFTVRRGEVFALIGPNGAGKTTTIRMVLGIYRPDEGSVLLCGSPPERLKLYSLAAYVPEETAVYPKLTGWEHLVFYATLYTGDRTRAVKVAERAAEVSGLGDALGRLVEGYSKGMKRRLILSLALALETPLLVLDEPTSGLDVHSAVRMRRLIRKAADEGRAVLLSSHNMFEVEYLADRVAFIASGKIIAIGTPASLKQRYAAENLEEAFVKAVEAAATV
ncbi:ABC transporter ATP-binding protein [Hyperthermus butylicus]|uniref:ABC transporter n=1 Tax=Hyperthermus butylicus (strain DSM 5456 / JCM 9403 / PLM1-5) TaxID=415426 RepID=A2BL39_HYPBU|nr:ABC transporter ATP-binding protein [Hyperthermus butylicus]ABM80700.1 putative ABC transporter [Hyperthermus butylicus DSM 5456]